MSAPPTISRVGACPSSSALPARSGRPPRDATAPTRSGSCAAAASRRRLRAGAEQPQGKARPDGLVVKPAHDMDRPVRQEVNVERVCPVCSSSGVKRSSTELRCPDVQCAGNSSVARTQSARPAAMREITNACAPSEHARCLQARGGNGGPRALRRHLRPSLRWDLRSSVS